MRKNILTFSIILILSISCSPKIKNIIEYHKENNSLSKNRLVEFDKDGNKIVEKYFSNPRSNRIVRMEYNDNKRISEVVCDYFEKQDTCVVRQFTKYEYKDEDLKKSTIFEADTAVRIIRTYDRTGNMEVTKIHSWEMFPKKNPELENAMKFIDTTYYDNKGRKIKVLRYNERYAEPIIETYSYSDTGYSLKIGGATAKDTTLYFQYHELQKIADKNNIDFKFRTAPEYKYEIEYY